VHPINHPRRSAAGFTLVELLVCVAIMAMLMAAGIPTMAKWMSSSRALSAAEFYADGLKMARSEAVKRNAVSRLSLTANATNGQYDWQVDICVPTPAVQCRSDSGSWSTATSAAAGDGVADFRSVLRSASSLPRTNLVALTLAPAGADEVYFTPVGWVDATIAPSLNQITIAPGSGREGDFPTTAVKLTLAGAVFKCDPTISATAADSRACQ